jgi:uncharacterized repeat protein (TIGR01451 family)
MRVPATVAAGEDIEYRICIENCSPAPAHHVIVRNPIPPNARLAWARPQPTVREPELQWHFGTLEGCGCREIFLVLTPTGSDDVKNCARVQFEHGQCVTTQMARPVLCLRKCAPGQAVLYDQLTFQLEVRNAGTAPATGVTLVDNLAEGLQHPSGKVQLRWDLGTLAPGECRCVEYQVVALKAGRLCNHAELTASGGIQERAECCVEVGEARLAVQKVGPAQSYANLPATYFITVTNPGNAPANNVTVSDPLPANTTFLSASNGGRLVANEVRWSLGTLAPGASRTVQVTLQAQGSGRVCNKTVATADRGLSADAEFCTDFVGVSALLLQLDDTGSDPLEVGAEGTYRIIVRNTGSEPATKVQIAVVLPDQMSLILAKGPTNFQQEGQRIVFEAVNLAAGANVEYELRARALRAGDVRLKVDLTADQLTSGPVHGEESITLYNPEAGPAAPPPAAPPPVAPEPPRAPEPGGLRQSRPRVAR